MRFRSALLMLLVTALALSAAAFAGERPSKPGKPETSRAHKPGTCHKQRAVVLKGTFVEAGTNAFTMNVRKANRHGRALKGEQNITVDERTKLRRKGKKEKATLADFVKDDRLMVLARCRPGEAAGSFTLLARVVFARPAKPAEG